MLSTQGIGIPDNPLSPYVLDSWPTQSRIVAQVAVCEALGDQVAWALIVGTEGGLAAYRVVYGNRKGRRRGRR